MINLTQEPSQRTRAILEDLEAVTFEISKDDLALFFREDGDARESSDGN